MIEAFSIKPPQCPVCKDNHVSCFLEIQQVPVFCNLLFTNRSDALNIQRGDISLGYCQTCGHVYNLKFQPDLLEYDQTYENALDFSPRFQNYAERLANQLVDKYDLRDKHILEIGCGQGRFLHLICELGGNTGIGFDPSYNRMLEIDSPRGADVKIIKDVFSGEYKDVVANFIVSRHVLEHLSDPHQLLDALQVSHADQDRVPVYFEVPNLLFILRELSIWDIIYEHYSYFGPSSLTRLFRDAKLRVFDIAEQFGGQFLSIEAFTGENPENRAPDRFENPALITPDITGFPGKFQTKIEHWSKQLLDMKRMGKRVVVWGAGSKGVTFLNLLDTQDFIEYIVDINPRKQGRYVSGSGQKIVPPEFLKKYRPGLVIVMNAIYKTEIEKQMKALGVSCSCVVA